MIKLKDEAGIIYKQPCRTCKDCLKYKCFEGFDNMSCDFAKYGCRQYQGEQCTVISKKG